MSMLGRVPRRVSSALRVAALRTRGHEIGKSVRIGTSKIQGRSVQVGEGCVIGDNVLIQGDEILIGPHVEIQDDVRIQTRRIAIGDETLIESGVTIGGLETPKSSVTIGSNCVVLHRSFLNSTYPLSIEDDVGIGGYCMIFTHGLWQSAFEGYPVTFGPVTIRKGAWLPWHVFVMPGVEIGEGATIGAGSVVLHSVPARSMAVGAPARVIRGPPEYPKAMTKKDLEDLLRRLLSDFAEHLAFKGLRTRLELNDASFRLITSQGELNYGVSEPRKDDIQILFTGPPKGSFWVNPLTREWHLDLSLPLHSETRGFIRRAGVRLRPRTR